MLENKKNTSDLSEETFGKTKKKKSGKKLFKNKKKMILGAVIYGEFLSKPKSMR